MSLFENLIILLAGLKYNRHSDVPCSPNSVSAALGFVDITQDKLSRFRSHSICPNHNITNDLFSNQSNEHIYVTVIHTFSPFFKIIPALDSVSKYSDTR